MKNRMVAAVHWLAEQARLYLAPRRAAREVRRLLGDESTVPRCRRTRQAGILKAVLRVLAAGPCPLSEVVAQASIFGAMPRDGKVYTRAQVLATLRYAAKRGYVTQQEDERWALLLPSAVSQRMYEAQSEAHSQPGEWFPARLAVPRPEQLPLGVLPVGGPGDQLPNEDAPAPGPGVTDVAEVYGVPGTAYTSPTVGHTTEPTT